MVRTTGRSTGCSTCRRRRIKCDEIMPVCTPCKRGRRDCAGPRRDLFFVHAVSSSGDADSQLSVSQLFVPTREDATNPPSIAPLPPKDVSLPMTIGNVHTYEQLWFSHLFDYFGYCVETIGACSWLGKVPVMLTRANTLPALENCVRAASMALFGTLANDVVIQKYARSWYSKGIQSLRSLLWHHQFEAPPKRSNSALSEEAICAIIMMSYFELAMRHPLDAWMQHMDAAASLVSLREAQACRRGFVHQMFRTIRLGTICSSILRRQSHHVATTEWSSSRYEHQREPLDRLLDILEHLPRILENFDALQPLGPTSEPLRWDLRLRVSLLIYELDAWPNNPGTFHGIFTANREEARNASESESGGAESHIGIQCPPREVNPDDQLGLLLSCLYSAGCSVSFSILATLEPGNFDPVSQVQQQCQAILSTVNVLNSRAGAPLSNVYMLANFSLNVVSLWSPSQAQRHDAQMMLVGL